MVVVDTITITQITFDPAKRDKTLADRGLDFEDAAKIFAGVTLDIEDTRKEWGNSHDLFRVLGRSDDSSRLHVARRGASYF